MKDSDILDALQSIDPGDLAYEDWVRVGMALKESGYGFDVWDSWSRSDSRYKAAEMPAKWASFNGSGYGGSPVTAGTIVQWARDRGWSPSMPYEDRAYGWDEPIDLETSAPFVDIGWLESETIAEPTRWDPVSELSRYLEILFMRDDYVGFCMTSFQDDEGMWKPTGGVYSRTAGDLLDRLAKCRGDIGKAFGDYNPEAGAWVRFNPLDGTGQKNANVTEYRYALVECDNVEKEKQLPLYKQLNLPIAVVVDSGNKSVHAIVHIDAGSEIEYKRRVDYLYKTLSENGVKVDTNNKNASRLSRLPGVMRAGRKQFIIEESSGPDSYEEWREWLEAEADDLPDIEAAEVGTEVQQPPYVIDQLLRKRKKMMLSGPSKAGKSMALIQLAMAVATGGEWLGFRCIKGKALYVNLELTKEDRADRMNAIGYAYGYSNIGENCKVLDLRGQQKLTLDKIDRKLSRFIKRGEYDLLIFDPVYKVFHGNESDSKDVGEFVCQLDAISEKFDVAVVYCHHHSKGIQGGKSAMDRASGSGVWARDADVILDMLQLQMKDGLNGTFAGYSIDATAWRVESVVRDRAPLESFDVFYDYPIHAIDADGVLADCKPFAAAGTGRPTPEQLTEARQKKAESNADMAKLQYERIRDGYPYGRVPLVDISVAMIEGSSKESGPSPQTIAGYFAKDDRFVLSKKLDSVSNNKDGNGQYTDKTTVARLAE